MLPLCYAAPFSFRTLVSKPGSVAGACWSSRWTPLDVQALDLSGGSLEQWLPFGASRSKTEGALACMEGGAMMKKSDGRGFESRYWQNHFEYVPSSYNMKLMHGRDLFFDCFLHACKRCTILSSVKKMHKASAKKGFDFQWPLW